MANKGAKKSTWEVLRASRLAKEAWLVHGFSTRRGGSSKVYGKGSLNLGFTKDDSRVAVEKNRRAFLELVGAKNAHKLRLVTLKQLHSDIIHCVREAPEHSLPGDGLVTDACGLLLAVLTADCLPVILADRKKHAAGVFHAGWRGTFKRITEKGVGEMRRWFGSEPRDLKAVIGPGIHSCCFEVGEEVREKFRARFAYADELFHEIKESDPIREKYPLLFLTARAPGHSELPKKLFLDLVEANRRQLMDAGVLKKNIEVIDLCTACRTDLLFSHRMERGKTGRMMGVVGIK